MKLEIIWSKDAGDELAEIISYIKHHAGKISAKKIYAKIIDAVEQISENAEGRRLSPLLKQFGINYVHQVNIHPWILFYKVEENRMEIISLIDGRRNIEEILYKKMLDGKIV